MGTALHVNEAGVYGVSHCWPCVFTGNEEYPRAPFSAWLRLQKGGNSPSLEKQFPERCKQPKAIRPQGNLGPSPMLTIKMSNVLKNIQEVAKTH